jgi:hypothetical protein
VLSRCHERDGQTENDAGLIEQAGEEASKRRRWFPRAVASDGPSFGGVTLAVLLGRCRLG